MDRHVQGRGAQKAKQGTEIVKEHRSRRKQSEVDRARGSVWRRACTRTHPMMITVSSDTDMKMSVVARTSWMRLSFLGK
jgi:hypothetical protein